LVNGITKEIDNTFGKYEEENPICTSIFEDLLGKKDKNA